MSLDAVSNRDFIGRAQELSFLFSKCHVYPARCYIGLSDDIYTMDRNGGQLCDTSIILSNPNQRRWSAAPGHSENRNVQYQQRKMDTVALNALSPLATRAITSSKSGERSFLWMESRCFDKRLPTQPAPI